MTGAADAMGVLHASGLRDLPGSAGLQARPLSTTSPGPVIGRLPVITVDGIPLHAITERTCVEVILAELARGEGGWVATHNLDHLRRLRSDRLFAAVCHDASLRVADGMPLLWACTLEGRRLPERVTGSNLVSSIAEAAAGADRSIFLLGGDPGTAAEAGQVLQERHAGLRIAGTLCPPPGFTADSERLSAVVSALVETRPDIVYVALGSPKQEYLIYRLLPLLPRSWWLGVGISFSFLCGDVARAPVWMQTAGFEWIHRLFQEPRRLARRYLLQGTPCAIRLLVSSAWRGRHSTRSST